MPLPFIPLIFAGLNIAQGLIGARGANSERDSSIAAANAARASAIAAANLRVFGARQDAMLRRQAANIQLAAARNSFSLQNRASDLQLGAARLNADSIISEERTAIFNTLLETGNIARGFQATADAARFNADIEANRAELALKNSRKSSINFRRDQNAQLATHRAGQSASGVQLTGSALLVDTAVMGRIEEEVANINYAGDVAFTDFRRQGEEFRRQAVTAITNRKFAKFAGRQGVKNIRAATTIRLQGAKQDFRAAQLSRVANLEDLITARRRAALEKESANISVDLASRASDIDISAANSRAGIDINSASNRARFAGISSIISGLSGAFGALSRGGVFDSSTSGRGAAQPTLATRGAFA